MLRKIDNAFECCYCDAVIIGTEEQAKSHMKVSVDPKLHSGFVYGFLNSGLDSFSFLNYYVVSFLSGNNEIKMFNPGLVTEGFDNEEFHGYIYNELSFIDDRGNLRYREAHARNSKDLRNLLDRERLALLDDFSFHRFKGLFEKSGYAGVLTLKDLTNKLNVR